MQALLAFLGAKPLMARAFKDHVRLTTICALPPAIAKLRSVPAASCLAQKLSASSA